MAPRNGRLSKPDSQGHYSRQLGWKLNDKGARVQHKFRLGADRREAERRDDRLRQLWEQIDSHAPPGKAVWDDVTLEIARQLAKGANSIALGPVSEDESPKDYAQRLQRIQNRFRFLRFVASDEQRHAAGVGEAAIDMRQIVVMHNPYEDYWRGRETLKAPPLRPTPDPAADGKPTPDTVVYAPHHTLKDDGATLHQAFEANAA
jgi:hypothetical protein